MDNRIQSVLISGLGAVGSVYASRLFALDPALVSVAADAARLARFQSDGMRVNDEALPFRLTSTEGPPEPVDLVLVAVKQHHLEQAIREMRRFVGPETLVLSLLNGIISEAMLADAFGAEQVVHGFCVGTDATRTGTNTRFTNAGRIVFGIPDSGHAQDPRLLRISALFSAAGIEHVIPQDILREQWWKFMMNVGVNQISAVLRAPYGVFTTVPEAEALMRSACHEVLVLAPFEGVSLAETDVDQYFRIIASLAPEGKTSMLQDIEAGRRTELELFAGTVRTLGKKHAVPTPVNDMLFNLIRSLERMNGALD